MNIDHLLEARNTLAVIIRVVLDSINNASSDRLTATIRLSPIAAKIANAVRGFVPFFEGDRFVAFFVFFGFDFSVSLREMSMMLDFQLMLRGTLLLFVGIKLAFLSRLSLGSCCVGFRYSSGETMEEF